MCKADIAVAPEQDALGGLSIPAGTSCLLVVFLERERQAVIDDKADVGLVDAHAEGIRRDDDRDIVLDKGLLCAGALVRLHTGVVGGSTEAVFEKRCCDLFGALPRPAVDDA